MNCAHRRLAVERLVLDTADLPDADETRWFVVARVARSVTGRLGGRPDRPETRVVQQQPRSAFELGSESSSARGRVSPASTRQA